MILSIIMNILTFPGVVVHEMAHQVFCELCGVKVHKVCYFRFGNPKGYVIHDRPDKPLHAVLVGVGPFLFNTLVAAVIALPFTLPSFRGTTLAWVSLWLGISIGMHSFPSTGDAGMLWRSLWARGMPLLGKLIAIPLVLVIYLGALGMKLKLDVIYGAAVALYLPGVLVELVRRVL